LNRAKYLAKDLERESTMAHFLALTSRGLFDALEKELTDLGFPAEKTRDGVYFESDWAGAYKVNLCSRITTRVLFPITDFPAESNEELYNGIKAIDFSEFINPNQTLAIEANIRDSSFRDQRFVALKSKDAIVDRFREQFGERPSVDKENPDMTVYIRVVKDRVSVSLDLTGETLSRRGYRREAGEAPLREHLAAALVLMTDWNKKDAIVDPMCGSGTFLIEAALIKANIAPGLFRRKFGFEKLKNFDENVWNNLVQEATEAEIETDEVSLFGSDRSKQAIAMATENAKRAGVEHMISFEVKAVEDLEAPAQEGLVVTNPPYGERIGDKRFLIDDYKDLSYVLKNRFQGYTSFVLSGDPELTTHLGMKASKKFNLANGQLECRYLRYEIRKEERPRA
jgi:putative N6-adenine-specific DNA methylase